MVRNFAIEKFELFVVRTSLIPLPFLRMFRKMMILKLISSEHVCPCHFRCFFGILARLLRISFMSKIDAELTADRHYLSCVTASLHDVETIHGRMLRQITSM